MLLKNNLKIAKVIAAIPAKLIIASINNPLTFRDCTGWIDIAYKFFKVVVKFVNRRKIN
jgi:hypothetical protein